MKLFKSIVSYNFYVKLFKSTIMWILFMLIVFGIVASLYYLNKFIDSLWFMIVVSFYFLNLILTWTLFLQNRQTKEKVSWLFLFILLPFLGHILFILFGQKYKFRMSKDLYFKKENFKYEKQTQPKFLDKDLENIMVKQSKLSKRSIYDCDIKYFSNGAFAMNQLFKDLKNAKKFIHIAFYIIKPGELFDELRDILLKKVKEGVSVRLLIDDFGRWMLPWKEIIFLKKQGIEIQIFGEINFPFIGSYNVFRMHRKIVIIDGKICHTGGINIGDEYINWDKKFGLWIDYQIKIMGEGVRTNSLLFLDLWNSISNKKLEYKIFLNERISQKTSQILTIDDSPEVTEPLIERALLLLISTAKKTISLVTPYLIPTSKLIEAIKTAALSGVKVKIFIPGRADSKLVLIGSDYYSRIFLKYGVKVYKTNNTFLHSKFGIFDDKCAYIGSANLDSRTIFYQWESIQIVNGKIVDSLRQEIKNYEKISKLYIDNNSKITRLKNFLIRTYVNILTPIM